MIIIMDTDIIEPRFMKALMRCYLLQKQAKRSLFRNRRFYHQVLKVYKWQHKIKNQIEAKKHCNEKPSSPQLASNSLETDSDEVRKSLWLTIVRKDIVQAYKRKVRFREFKIMKSKTVAYRCQSHFKEFHRMKQQRDRQRRIQSKNNNKHKQD